MVVTDIIGAGKLFLKEENDDSRIGLNIVHRGKIGVKGLFPEYGKYSAKYSPTVEHELDLCQCLSRRRISQRRIHRVI